MPISDNQFKVPDKNYLHAYDDNFRPARTPVSGAIAS
jgi:hypothetical protein